MTLPKLKNPRWHLGLAFGFPVFAMLLLMIISGTTPFGNGSMLYCDMFHQYYPFFKAFRLALLSGDSLLWNWDVGMGMDYLGMIAYYLASPLNLVSVLLPESWMMPYFFLMGVVKTGLAGLFFAIFLKKIFGRDDLSLSLFGSFYALCAWSMGYRWNIMWLDTFALLPLVILGAVALLKERKFFLYTVTLALSIACNYYIGLFTCIFVFLFFFCYEICRCKSIGRFFGDLAYIALFSFLAIGLTAFLELPAFMSLQTTHSSSSTFPEGFGVNMAVGEHVTKAREAWAEYLKAKETGEGEIFALLLAALGASVSPVMDGMKQVAGNFNAGITPTFIDGLPNLYCGVHAIGLSFIFLTSKQIKLRDKICSVGLLLFLMLSFVIRQLDYIWHGFHFTNQIPYRFSFMCSFVLLYMAYRALLLIRRVKVWQLIVAGVLNIGIMLCSSNLTDSLFIAFNGVFLLLYVAVWIYALIKPQIYSDSTKEEIKEVCADRKKQRSNAGLLLCAVMCIELVMNVVNFGVHFPFGSLDHYPLGKDYTASMIRYMKEREEDNLFYRAEVTHAQTLNDGAMNDYHGLSTFTSSANANVTVFAKALGFSADKGSNRYCYEEGSPVSNLFLNLKYLIDRDSRTEGNSYFDFIHRYGTVSLLENKAYLPLGFLAELPLGDLSFEHAAAGSLYFQNRLFIAATGISDTVWDFTPQHWLTIRSADVQIKNHLSYGYASYDAGSDGGTLTYSYAIEEDGFLCLDMTMYRDNHIVVLKNSRKLFEEDMTFAQTLAVGDVQAGDEIRVEIICKADEASTATIRSALLDKEAFQKGYDILKSSTLELTEFSNAYVAGTIKCNREGLLYTSIPQDGNWEATVDGEEAEIILVGDAMIGLKLTEGEHEITFTYVNQNFSTGLAISLTCLLAFACVSLTVYLPILKNKRGKYQK